ncbi:uncharacterized protein AC631_05606 [Debaryomyces fabryi]|uniref:HDA1 complex subunit 3 n=1 Tax=Debaryomyces fabryi TaxID=58627 RepID=A0A0V1PR04_9ASCO|nr:uncharacterized protein AC631_05606 [Debaryomyces fabryi]KRZ98634.1 hypothetical protein AC631_05606 [Debaryomyces fabryi]CUM55966.1 unnamed protein product [Debaryomyces fabryi]
MNLLKILDGTPEPPIIDLRLENVNRSGDYHLPTPMYEFQKELTDQIVSLHYPDILKYCETNDKNDLIIKSLEICINNCMLVSTHPYLLINHYMPKNLALKDMLSKLADTSGKFSVLKDLMNVIILNTTRNTKTIGVFLNNNAKFFDLVEALLLGCSGNKTIKRYVGNYVEKESSKASKSSDSNKPVTNIYLLPFDGKMTKDDEQLAQAKFDALIVFDSYVDTNHEFFQKIRTQNRRKEAIIIRLVPMRTVEHCQLYYSNMTAQKDYLYKIISSIVCLREHIGILPPDIFPIFNQHLKYLSHTFFDNAFRGSRSNLFPEWPLPELSKIPKFSATDIERSLLTEVHYHYTPYDSAEGNLHKPQKKKQSYYEAKRLELDYVTNSLRNDFNTLIGIFGNESNMTVNSNINRNILTHKLITQLKTAYLNWNIANEEHNTYIDFNRPDIQARVGRREEDTKHALSKIIDDIDHTESRILFAEKKIARNNQELESTKEEMKNFESKLITFIADNNITDEKLNKFYEQQIKIWEIQDKIKENLSKINSKHEEKNYMANECSNAANSITESEHQVKAAQELNEELKRKIAASTESGIDERTKFKKQKRELIEEIESERIKNKTYQTKLGKSLKFLKETSHLKKRKSRGITPNGK